MKETNTQLKCKDIIRYALDILEKEGYIDHEAVFKINNEISNGQKRRQQTIVKPKIENKPEIKKLYPGLNMVEQNDK